MTITSWHGALVDDFAGPPLIDRAGEERNDLVDLDAEVVGEAGLIAEQIAHHAKRRFCHALKQHRLRLQLLEHAGDFVGLGNGRS